MAAPTKGDTASESRTSGQVEDIADRANDTFRGVADQVEGAASAVAQRGRETGERVEEDAGNLKGALDKSINDQPMATLAIAAVLGFVLGAIWKS
jgi:ElaB/YqjD/DUF883 family membrane-anchored ribosome-binding protein